MSKVNIIAKLRGMKSENSDPTASPKKQKNKGSTGSTSFIVDVADVDRHRFTYFQGQELQLFNAFSEGLSSRARSFPKQLLEYERDLLELFVTVAEHKFQIYEFWKTTINSRSVVLPEVLQPFSSLLLKDGRFVLPEAHVLIVNLGSANGKIHSLVRKKMALSFINFYKQQAELIITESVASKTGVSSFRPVIEFIEKMEDFKKKHVQIPKELVKYTYNVKEETTILSTPYNSEPIKLRHVNLNEIDFKWNYVIVKGNEFDVEPWEVEFKQIGENENYLIKYFDGRGQAPRKFGAAKSRDKSLESSLTPDVSKKFNTLTKVKKEPKRENFYRV